MSSRSEVIDKLIANSRRSGISNSVANGTDARRKLMAMSSFEFAKVVCNSYEPATSGVAAIAEPYEPQWDDPDWVYQTRQSAMHEAAHAAVAFAEGGTVREILIHGGGGGLCRYADLEPSSRALVDVAGYVTTDEPSGIYAPHCANDRAQLIEHLRQSGRHGTDDQLLASTTHLEPIADSILAATWQFRTACVELLLEQGRIGEYEAKLLWEQYQ